MSAHDPINLADIIAQRDTYDPVSGTHAIPVEVFDALVEAVEAAAEVFDAYHLPTGVPAEDRLGRALARFQFGSDQE